MTLDTRLHELGRDARMRRAQIVVLAGLPIALAICAWSAKAIGAWAALIAAAIASAALVAIAQRAMRAIDTAWIARRLDASRAHFEDSADLLFREPDGLSPLQQLQRARLHRRFEADPVAELKPAWPWRGLGAVWVIALLAIVAVVLWNPRSRVGAPDQVTPDPASATRIERAQLEITAPAYTKLPKRTESALEARVAEGARIAWHLQFAPEPKSAALAFHDGSRMELSHREGEWTGERVMQSSALYRIVLEGAPPIEDDRLHRLDVIADHPPEVRVIQPEKSLTLLEEGQHEWDLAFEASDDFGIAAANLTITLAQGTGENIAFKEQTQALGGEDIDADAASRHLRYRHRLDLTALGVAQGDDVIVRLVVSDNRAPNANTTKSASFILRWPPEESSDSVGMEGIFEKTMPAYFRSQRQIIIDTETLLAQRPPLSNEEMLSRSDGIGVDQKILRLRYGQFLGEEFETRSEPESPAAEHADGDKNDARADALTAHAHEQARKNAMKFGDAGDVMAEYGHTHDVDEAATLIDPETKAILKSALNEMWQSELHLRQGRPEEALPFERKALEYIKQVQQSTRIYLARVGLELPEVDEGRRLSGDRKGVGDREAALIPAIGDDDVPAALWRELENPGATDLDPFERWVHAHASALPDSLTLLAASDRVRRDPACVECRVQLRNALWPLLSVPATAASMRIAPDAEGRAYLDAIGAGSNAAAGKAR
ncbi:MAG: hypothetical protein ACREPX_10595 [Rhodanobacteraceae bacterium]